MVLVCDPIPVVARNFFDYQRKVVVLNFSKIDWIFYGTCLNVFIEVIDQYLFDVRVRTGNIITRYYSMSHYHSIAIILFNCENLFGVRNWLS